MATAPANITPSLKRTLATLPAVAQLETLLDAVRSKTFYRFDGDELDRAETSLIALLSEAREKARREDRALHGAEVMA